MKFEMFSNIISRLNTDGHMVMGLIIFAIGSAIQYFHGLSGDYVAFTTTILGFLGGHSWVKSQEKGDGNVAGNGSK